MGDGFVPRDSSARAAPGNEPLKSQRPIVRGIWDECAFDDRVSSIATRTAVVASRLPRDRPARHTAPRVDDATSRASGDLVSATPARVSRRARPSRVSARLVRRVSASLRARVSEVPCFVTHSPEPRRARDADERRDDGGEHAPRVVSRGRRDSR